LSKGTPVVTQKSEAQKQDARDQAMLLTRSEAKLAKEMLNMRSNKHTNKPLFSVKEEEKTIPAIQRAE